MQTFTRFSTITGAPYLWNKSSKCNAAALKNGSTRFTAPVISSLVHFFIGGKAYFLQVAWAWLRHSSASRITGYSHGAAHMMYSSGWNKVSFPEHETMSSTFQKRSAPSPHRLQHIPTQVRKLIQWAQNI